MVISQPPENNPSSGYYQTLLTLLIILNIEYLMFYTCNYNIGVTHRNGAIKHIFLHESDPRRDHRQIVLYSFCRHALALHLTVKILLRLSV